MKRSKNASSTAQSCQSCGDESQPCCAADDPDLKGKPCAGDFYCVNGFCAKTSGDYHAPCSGPSGTCDPAFKGLACVAKPNSSDFWCDCADTSKGQACGARMVCWDSPSPGSKSYGAMQNYNCMNGLKNELLQRAVTTVQECQALCDADANCTTYEVDAPNIQNCWLSKNIHAIDKCCIADNSRQMYPWTDRPDATGVCT